MTNEEFKARIAEQNKAHDIAIANIRQEYAMSNNPYKVGDIVEDHQAKIKINSISWSFSFASDYPSCVYRGPRLKKDGTPFKIKEIGVVYQSNITIKH